jgi:DNA-binding IclR family transcriptional regulator
MTFRSIKSAERTLALFELFSAHQRPLTVGEISRLLDIPQPSVTMLVRNLVALGYLEHNRFTRTYTPTLRIALLGSWIHQSFVNDRQLEVRLAELYNAVGETTFIGIQNGVQVQYILFIKSQSPNRFDVQAWMSRPLATSAVGKALLSLKPDAEVRGLLHRANDEAIDPRLKVSPTELLEELTLVREQGYAETSGRVTDGIGVLAMPMQPLHGQSAIAVAVGGPLEKIREKKARILEELSKFVEAFTEAERNAEAKSCAES